MNQRPTPNQQLIVFYVLWGAFLAGITIIYFFLRRDAPNAGAVDAFPWMIGGVPVFLSAVLRWIALPRVHDAQQALVLFVLGLALAEAATFFGLFLAPNHQRELFTLSVLGIVQFFPIFAHRFSHLDGGSRGG